MVFSSIASFISDNLLTILVIFLTYVFIVFFITLIISLFLWRTGRCKRVNEEEEEESSVNDIMENIARPSSNIQQSSLRQRPSVQRNQPPYKTRVLDLNSIDKVHPQRNSNFQTVSLKKDSLGLLEKEDFENYVDNEDRKEVS